MRRTAAPVVVAAAALLLAVPAAGIVLPPEPAPVVAIQQNAGIHVTTPAVGSDDVGTVTGSETAISGTIGHPLSSYARTNLTRILPSGARQNLGFVPTVCVRACGTFIAQSRFGPVNVASLQLTPANARFVLRVEIFRTGLAREIVEKQFTVRRVPPPDALNVFAIGMQVNQGIQSDIARLTRRRATTPAPRPSFPTADGATLVDRKPTIVRVFAAADGIGAPSLSGVTARLEGNRDGEELPGSPLAPVSAGAIPDATGVEDLIDLRRTALSSDDFSINFRLPASWRRGTVNLRAIVNPPDVAGHFDECSGCEDRGNQARVRTTYAVGPSLQLAPWQFDFTHPDATVARETRSLSDFFAGISDLYPIRPSFLLVGDYNGTIETQTTNCQALLREFVWNTFLTSEPGLRVGVLPRDPLICTTDNGLTADGINGPGGSAASFGVDGLTPPHEVAHDLGVSHFSCFHGETQGGGCTNTLPRTHGAIDGFGYDLRTQVAMPPGDPFFGGTHNHDLMSYGTPNWISRFTFQALVDALRARAGDDGVASTRGVPAPAPLLLVSGQVLPDGRAALTGALSAEGTPLARAQPAGPYELRALDRNGATVHSQKFGPHYATHGRGTGIFSVTIPNPDRIGAVVVVEPDGRQVRLNRSAAAPTLSYDDRALANLSAEGTRKLTWQAADLDGDPLVFALQFSSDGGRRWRTVGFTGGTARSFDVDVSRLPATAAGRFRMLASDGFNTRVVTSSRTLAVPNHRPRATITGPPTRTTLAAGDSLDVTGAAIDPDQRPGSAQLRWDSARDGYFGSGGEATLVRPSVGAHTITLRALDSRGAAASARIAVRVVPATVTDRRAPRLLPAARRADGIHLRFSEEVVGLGADALRLEVAGKRVAAAVVPGADEARLVPLARLGRGALRVRLAGPVTDLAGNAVRNRTVLVRR
jgi:hypothetical protein